MEHEITLWPLCKHYLISVKTKAFVYGVTVSVCKFVGFVFVTPFVSLLFTTLGTPVMAATQKNVLIPSINTLS